MPLKFIYFCDLLEKLEAIEHHDPPLLRSIKAKLHLDTINQWFRSHRRIIDASSTDRAALLSAFLPERRTDRVYSLQEPGLIRVLGRCLGFGRERLAKLTAWKPSNHVDLATWVCEIQRSTDAGMSQCSVTVEDVDAALGQLAARSRFSGPRVRTKASRSASLLPEDALKPLLYKLPSRELKWFIRLVLKKFGQVVLDENLILRNVHVLLPDILKFQADFEAACESLKNAKLAAFSAHPDAQNEVMLREVVDQCLNPRLGIKIGRPEFMKARSIKHCLQITGRGKWNIEPKYDGEYCQVHIDLEKRENMIQIFSKSGKDSTQDKIKLHKWIRKCLQIGTSECKFKKRCILEGELVLFSDKDQAILEFCKIRKHVPRSGTYLGTEADSQPHAYEHLEIVFFDALLIDDEVVMSQKYEVRRQRLKDLIVKYVGRAQTGSWGTIDFGKLSHAKAVDKVERAFAKAIAQRCEGLILKPCDGPYFSLGKSRPGCHDGKVIKLKKDYIPGFGDTADFAIVGASFIAADAQAWGEKNVKYTHFVLACLDNKVDVLRYESRPMLRIMGILSRPCIPVPIIQQISSLGRFLEEPFLHSSGYSSTYDLRIVGTSLSMDVTFKTPFIVEVMGAGFDKPSSQNHYMLRHPRIIKIHQDRLWEDVVSFDDLQTMAKKAVSLPEDLIEEQREWLRRLHTAENTKKVQGQFLTTTSPFSDRLTEVTSPASTTRTGLTSTRTSPVKTPRTSAVVPLIRVDSVELRPGEERVHLVATMPGLSVIDQRPTKPSTNNVLALSEKAADPFKKPAHPQAPTALEAGTAKRKCLDIQDETDSLPASKRVVLEDDTGMCSKENSKKAYHRVTSPPSAESPKNGDGQAFFTPLSELHNSVTRPLSASSNGSTSRPINGTTHQFDVGDVVHISERQAKQPTSSTGVSDPLDCAPKTATVVATVLHETNTVVLNTKNGTKVDACLPTSSPSTARDFHTAPSSPIGSSTPFKLFKNYTFYLSPCVASFPLLTQDLLPLIEVQPRTQSITHWHRHTLPTDQPSLGPVVGESQAYPGLQKAVLVESRRIKPTERVVMALLELNLVRNERVELWDWRVVEGVLDLHDDHTSPEHEKALKDLLKKWYLGSIFWDEKLKRNSYMPGENKHLIESMMAQVGSH